MRTPAMIVGMVLAPCGLMLALTCPFAPDWGEQSQITGEAPDFVEHQGIWGIWDICSEVESTHQRACGLDRQDYVSRPEGQAARGLMITSMVVTLLGVALYSLGVRCWSLPRGVLSLVAVYWYNYQLYVLPGLFGW